MDVVDVDLEVSGPRVREVVVPSYGGEGDERALYCGRLELHRRSGVEGRVGHRRVELAPHLSPVAVVRHADVDVAGDDVRQGGRLLMQSVIARLTEQAMESQKSVADGT